MQPMDSLWLDVYQYRPAPPMKIRCPGLDGKEHCHSGNSNSPLIITTILQWHQSQTRWNKDLCVHHLELHLCCRPNQLEIRWYLCYEYSLRVGSGLSTGPSSLISLALKNPGSPLPFLPTLNRWTSGTVTWVLITLCILWCCNDQLPWRQGGLRGQQT